MLWRPVLKSKCMIFNYREAPIELLKGMEVVERLRCLGVILVNKWNCFLQHTWTSKRHLTRYHMKGFL